MINSDLKIRIEKYNDLLKKGHKKHLEWAYFECIESYISRSVLSRGTIKNLSPTPSLDLITSSLKAGLESGVQTRHYFFIEQDICDTLKLFNNT